VGSCARERVADDRERAVAAQVIMPALGMAQESGKVLRWLKAEGQSVAQGEPLLEIETDKVTVSLEAPASGILAQVRAAEGETVPVGQLIALIAAPGEPLPERSASSTIPLATPSGDRPQPLSPTPASGSVPSGTPARPYASPKARRLARQRGVDLAAFVGTGPGGAVLAGDVRVGGRTVSAPPPTLATSAVWRVMAERTTQSWTSAPHFFLFRDVNARALLSARDVCRDRGSSEVTYTDLLVRVTAAALREHPRLNGRWESGRVIANADINVGLAVAVKDGLIVPVIHRADQLSLEEIVARRLELMKRAQEGALELSDVQGGTFTLSNLGMYGVDAFTAVLNPPQAAILAVGRIADRVVPVEGRPGVQPMMTLSLACDHRVADGVRGAQFLETLAALLAKPPVD